MLLCILCLAAGAPAWALTPLELFEEGNRLYRDELYWAALLRYRQAEEAGLSTPLLHYNTGVAHYRAQQYERARESLMQAVDSPDLRLAAQFNLGLTEYAAGNNDAAVRWFRLVRDQQQNRKLSTYATEAIARIVAEQMEGIEEIDFDRRAFDRDEPIAHFELAAQAGFGADSNPYRSPVDPYTDYSKPDAPLVRPFDLSGAYIPFELDVKYRIDAYPNESFFGAYRLAGISYVDAGLNDADEYAHEVSIGSEYRKRDYERNREREVYSAFSISRHQELYFDPSTSIYFLFIDEDGVIQQPTQRMDYVRYGPELNFRQRLGDLTFGAGFKGQLWNYTNEFSVPEYDHEYLVLSGFAQYQFFASSLVRMQARWSTRQFGDRPAYTLDGEVLPENPDLQYDYLDVQLTARQRITEKLWFGVDYLYTERTDKFVGYNDYIRDRYGASFRWHLGYRLDVSLRANYMLYEFPRAWAFDNPDQPRKTLERLEFRGEATFRLTEHLFVVGNVEFTDSQTNDLRFNYDRMMLSAGVRWVQ